MHLYFNFLGISIPSYGLMIITGVLLANLIARIVIKREGLDIDDFIILECYAVLGGLFGAKLLYLITAFKYIDWSRFFEPEYFSALMRGGFVFYGGLIGGILLVFIAACFHKIEPVQYIRKMIFLIPFVHAFGRLGCFMAGCCFGIPYHGFGAVVFPENSFAISGVELFPVQLVEALCLLAISFIILFLQLKFRFKYTLELYFILYGIVRFVLEKYRYDSIRGGFWLFSTSQWISILLIVCAVASLIYNRRKQLS